MDSRTGFATQNNTTGDRSATRSAGPAPGELLSTEFPNATLIGAVPGLWFAAIFTLLGAAALCIDIPVANLLVDQRRLKFLDDLLDVVEPFGNAFSAVLVAAAIGCCNPTLLRSMPRLLAAAAGAGLMANICKLCVSRRRPYTGGLDVAVWDTFQGVFPGLSAGSGGQSFPSAHVATATGLAIALCVLFPRGRRLFAATVSLVALQRINAGSHFVSDTCWGAVVGLLWCRELYGHGWLGNLFTRLELKLGRESTAATSSGAVTGVAVTDIATIPLTAAMNPSVLDSTTSSSTLQFRSTGFSGGANGSEFERNRVADLERVEPVDSLSIVVPIFNEEENVPRLYERLMAVVDTLAIPVEIVLVDDGSNDSTPRELQRLVERDERVRVVTLRRNFGQTAAMSAGIQYATGAAIALMDGDLQNDPGDLPMMLRTLESGYDLIHGWRRDRQDRFFDRKLPSLLANRLIARITGFPIHDLGCTLKLIRREIAKELNLYGEMHRFIPILAHHRGARSCEVVVRHHARQFGQSKYGLSRTIRVVLDLVTVVFLTQYSSSPMKLFGRMGFAAMGVGCVAAAATIAMKLLQGVDMTGNPLLLAGVFGVMLGTQFFCLGMLGEMSIRTYYAAQNQTAWAVRKVSERGTLRSTPDDGYGKRAA